MQYKLWNRRDSINGVPASHFLNMLPFKDYNGDIILICADNGTVCNVECKDILAQVYNIAPTLNLDSFMEVYFSIVEPESELDVEQEPNEEE